MAEIEIPTGDDLAERVDDSTDKRFSKRVAMLTAIYAVCLSICALGGANAAKEMMMAQQQASNQWAFYQAKAQREHMYRLERTILEAEQADREDRQHPTSRDRFIKIIDQLSSEEKRFASEKLDIETKARTFEHERDVSMARDPYFDYAEVMLQLSIILASVSIISGSRAVLKLSLAAAGVGALLGFNGFTLLMKLPFLS